MRLLASCTAGRSGTAEALCQHMVPVADLLRVLERTKDWQAGGAAAAYAWVRAVLR